MQTSSEPAGILAPGGSHTIAELCAMELDGVVARVFGQAFRSVAVPESPALRAAALACQVPANLAARAVLGRATAAWVYGCAPPPLTIALLLDRAHRTSMLPPRSGCTLHEVLLDPYDVDHLGGAQVTSALRTAVDVSLYEPADIAAPVLLAFANTATLNCPLGRIKSAVTATHHIPGSRSATALLRELLDR